MRCFLFVVIILFSVLAAIAAPFLTSDPQTGVDRYRLVCQSASIDEESAAAADTSAWHDLINLPEGEYRCDFYAGRTYAIDEAGQEAVQWSEPTSFLLKKPAKPESAPTQVKVRK